MTIERIMDHGEARVYLAGLAEAERVMLAKVWLETFIQAGVDMLTVDVDSPRTGRKSYALMGRKSYPSGVSFAICGDHVGFEWPSLGSVDSERTVAFADDMTKALDEASKLITAVHKLTELFAFDPGYDALRGELEKVWDKMKADRIERRRLEAEQKAAQADPRDPPLNVSGDQVVVLLHRPEGTIANRLVLLSAPRWASRDGVRRWESYVATNDGDTLVYWNGESWHF